MKTIEYYNTHADAFYKRTINADVSDSYAQFLKHLPAKAHLLDAGCGVGRDSKFFLSKGHSVEAFDASKKMVALAIKETGLEVKQSTFNELSAVEAFDGVWAQASLLHVPYEHTQAVYQKIHRALKPNAIFYASYKYGDGHMETPERDFYHMNETSILPFLNGLFEPVTIWVAEDKRSQVAPSKAGAWLNMIARKVG